MKKYDIIVVDPPWEIKKIKREVRPNQVKMDYQMLDIKNIKNMKIKSISAENSLCFLWTIQKYLPVSFSILETWGFKYLLTLTWNKNNGMCLFGFHYKTEFVLVGYRGKINLYPKRPAIPSVFSGHSERHSAKPDEFYLMLNALEGNKIDIFARKERYGWDVWGNEIEPANLANINIMEIK